MSIFDPSPHILNFATTAGQPQFGSLSVFGSVAAQLSEFSQKRGALLESVDSVRVYPVQLSIKRALVTANLYESRPLIVSRVAQTLLPAVKPTGGPAANLLKDLCEQRTTPRSVGQLQEALTRLNIDGLAYRNGSGFCVINLDPSQVRVAGEPLIVGRETIRERYQHALEEEARPAELGDAYFWIDGQLVDISPERNHRDWLVKNQESLGLPDYIQQKPVRALWEGYKRGIIRIVWDRGSRWRVGAGHGQGNVLYINGFERDVWSNMRPILNQRPWVGEVNTVVIEYVREVNGKPNWYHTDIFKGGAVEALYRGRRPRRERLPPDAVYGGEPGVHMVREVNHMMNTINDSAPQKVLEMFNGHFMSTGFFDKFKHVPHNGYMTHPGHNYNVYLGLT